MAHPFRAINGKKTNFMRLLHCATRNPSPTIEWSGRAEAFVKELLLTTKEETRVALTCSSCGNDQNFLVKTLQMHVVHLDDSRVEVSEEGRPAVLEVLCDECETAMKLEDMDEGIRKELMLTLGAR